MPKINVEYCLENEYYKILDYHEIKKHMYSISNYGNIKNNTTEKILKSFPYDGYLKIRLRTYTGAKNYIVSRLVAHTFIDSLNNNPGLEVHHKNSIRDYNFYKNLEYVTGGDNVRHSFSNGNHKGRHNGPRLLARGPRPNRQVPKPYMKGELNHKSINTSDRIHSICNLLEKGFSNFMITGVVNFDNLNSDQIMSLLNSLRHKKTWHHITDLYMY